jgi:hypothetical protein
MLTIQNFWTDNHERKDFFKIVELNKKKFNGGQEGEEDKRKEELADVGFNRRDSSRKSNVSPTETAHLCIPSSYDSHRGRTWIPAPCMNIVKTRERSRLSQERLEQLMHVRMSDVSPSNITEKQLLLWVRLFWYETKARRLFLIMSLTSLQEMSTYLKSLLHNKTWRNTRLQLSKLLKIETSSIFHLFQVISNHRKKKHRNFRKL